MVEESRRHDFKIFSQKLLSFCSRIQVRKRSSKRQLGKPKVFHPQIRRHSFRL